MYTEKSRAENNAILQSYENYNVKYVDWMTQGVNVCALCLEGERKNPYLMSAVEDLIPAHPNCGCRWTTHVDYNVLGTPKDNPDYVDLVLGNSLPFIRDYDGKPLIIMGDTAEGKQYFMDNYAIQDLSRKEYEFFQLWTDGGIGPLNDYLRNGESVKKKSERAWNKLNKITSYP